MHRNLKRIFSAILAVIILLSATPAISAADATYDQIVNAATSIIKTNEGEYNTVVRNDNGALSIGFIGWHATNALNLLKDIIARNPSQGLNILGAALYNEVISSTYWETRIATSSEASAISILISTAEGIAVQDSTAREYISGYVTHGQRLGITEPEALVFFADYQNQNGYTGAENFFYQVVRSYSVVNLSTLYNASSKNSRRTRTYNFCASVNWSSYSQGISPSEDTQAPTLTDVLVSDIDSTGYTVSCQVGDNVGVSAVYFAVYYRSDGADSALRYSQTPTTDTASLRVKVSEFSDRAGEYCTYIFVFDDAGNYVYAALNTITVPDGQAEKPAFSLTVSSSLGETEQGGTVKWSAAAANGSGSYLYTFELYRNGAVIERRSASDYSDFSYKAENTGTYYVKVRVTDSVSGETATAQSTDTLVYNPIIVNSFVSTNEAYVLGQTVSWTVNAGGGDGSLKYAFTVYRNGTVYMSGGYSATESFSFKPSSGGEYYAIVSISDDSSQVKSAQSGTISVIAPLSVHGVAFSSSYAIAGMSVTVSAQVEGGTGDSTCVFSIYCDGELVLESDSTKATGYTFTLPSAGVYTAQVRVTDADSTVASASGGGLTAEETAKQGDANCDGDVNAADARYALRCAARLESPLEGFDYALDVDGDGHCTAADARIILRVSARLQTF